MRRALVLAVACGLLAAAPLADTAEAKPGKGAGGGKLSQAVKTLGAGALDCATAPAAGTTTVGSLNINRRGKSGGGGQFHFQVKLDGGATTASNTYSVQVFRVSSPTCTAVGQANLKTNSQGKGVANLSFSLAGDAATPIRVLLTDTLAGNAADQNLGTAQFTLTP